jgi:hypothetical protein
MYELFLETWEEEGLSIIPKTIGAIIGLCFSIWFNILSGVIGNVWLGHKGWAT